MPTFVIKPDRDADLYIGWSTVTESPHWWGSRVEVTAYLAERASGHRDDRPDVRLARADQYGTSDMSVREGGWSDDGLMYEQRGVLPRKYLAAACEALGRNDEPAVWALLLPLDGGDDAAPGLLDGRCRSCEHETRFHQSDGCWFTIDQGRMDSVLTCPCSVKVTRSDINGDDDAAAS